MPPISFDFRDSSVLVTGGTQGIGLAVAEAYARAGANVAICARTEGDVSATVAALDELGAGAVYGVTADLGEPDGAGQLYDDVAANLGVLDILVNNAAAQGNFPFPEMDSARWRWMAQVNLEAPFELSRRFVLARQDPGGVIINVVTTQVMRHAKRARGLRGHEGRPGWADADNGAGAGPSWNARERRRARVRGRATHLSGVRRRG